MSIFDNARNLLKDLQSKATSVGQFAGNEVNQAGSFLQHTFNQPTNYQQPQSYGLNSPQFAPPTPQIQPFRPAPQINTNYTQTQQAKPYQPNNANFSQNVQQGVGNFLTHNFNTPQQGLARVASTPIIRGFNYNIGNLAHTVDKATQYDPNNPNDPTGSGMQEAFNTAERVAGAYGGPLLNKVQGEAGNIARGLKTSPVGSAVLDQAGKIKIPGNPFNYTPATNLTPAEQQVETNFGNAIKNNLEGAIAKYKQTFGNELNTDNARELSSQYSTSNQTRGTLSKAVHEPASSLIKHIYEQELQVPDPKGNNIVLFTAGGTGAGKTSAIRDIPQMQAIKDQAQIVYDTNMASAPSAIKKIQQALDADKKIVLLYTHRNPVESLVSGTLPRAERIGRTVPLDTHLQTHLDAPNAIQQIAEHFKGNENVQIHVLDNTQGKGNPVMGNLDLLKNLSYNKGDLRTNLESELENAYNQGKISDTTYQGTKGSPAQENIQANLPGNSPSSASQPQVQLNPLTSENPVLKNPQESGKFETNPLGQNTPPEQLPGTQLTDQNAAANTLENPSNNIPAKALSGDSSNGNVPPSAPGSQIDPVQKIIQALQEAQPIRGSQEALYSAERAKRVARVASVGSRVPGEQGYFAQLGQLKGELPKVQFEGIRKQIGQPDIDHLFNTVEQSNLSPFEKVSAKGGLAKLLGAEGGTVPNNSELKLLNDIFPPEFVQAVLAKRPLMQRLLNIGSGLLNLPRAVMSTLDFSAPLRQGVFLVGRPKQWMPAFGSMFKYAFNPKSYEGLQQDIQSRPTYPLMRQAKLAITDMGPLLQSREEAFMSNLSEKIPGFGTLAKGSNRAYSGFLNKLRADTFDDLVKNAKSQGINVEGKTLDDIAKFVNSATGRGDIGALSRMAPIMNGLFFSPRLIASRINMLNPMYYANLDPFVRKEALKSLLTFGATAGTVLGLAKLGGAQVGGDPTSADFGKIKVGNTRYDILGGYQQYIKLASQLLTGKVTSSITGKTMTLGEGYKPLTRKDIIMKFFEGKESPVAGFISALATGQNGAGQPINVPEEVISRFIPLVLQDLYDLAKDKGSIGQGLAMAIPGVFGVGSQTYGKTELVNGQDQLGQPTSQVRPVPTLPQVIAEKTFGKQPLGSSGATNVQTYFDQLSKMPKDQAAAKFEEIRKSNPTLAKQIIQVAKDKKKGVTVEDQVMKTQGVASGDRATSIVKEFNKLKTPQEKAQLWEHYVKTGVITPEIAKQMKILLNKKQGSINLSSPLASAQTPNAYTSAGDITFPKDNFPPFKAQKVKYSSLGMGG